ncbi:MAG: hypothetical protein JEZ06_20810 [Anaerolineaceae bacterium]|nr:hypothetical protein [Anaerolineaceae bacterium]
MAKKKPVRRNILDPAVADLLSNMEQKQADSQLPRKERIKKSKENAKIKARREQRATFDLPPILRQWIMNLAADEKVPASQLVTLALLRFYAELEAKEIDLGIYKDPSRSPRYDWNLIFPEDMLPKNNNKKV